MEDNNVQIEHRPITDLKPYPRNARRHSKKQIQGFVRPNS